MRDCNENSRQVREYLDRRSPARAGLREAISKLAVSIPDTVIFGGMLRDFALAGPRSFSSDVDLVTNSTVGEIEHAIGEFNPTRNKFGGFRFVVGKWQFDLWPFKETWAFQHHHVEGRVFSDLLKTTFFNVDAALFHLESRRLSCSDVYERGVNERVLEINLEANPSPHRMARRGLMMAGKYGLRLGPKLVDYILANTDELTPWLGRELRGDMVAHVRRHPYTAYNFLPQLEIPISSEPTETTPENQES